MATSPAETQYLIFFFIFFLMPPGSFTLCRSPSFPLSAVACALFKRKQNFNSFIFSTTFCCQIEQELERAFLPINTKKKKTQRKNLNQID